jgi:alkylation response protein AidB-like acyl-CoA dehydrogenase
MTGTTAQTDEHRAARETVRAFIEREMVPRAFAWRQEGRVDREIWAAAGALGLLGPDIEEKYGGGGLTDYRFHTIRNEEMARAGLMSPAFYVHGEVVGGCLATLGTDEQKQRWLPGLCSGRHIFSVAVTEPGAGSDMTAIRTRSRRDGETYVIDGQKSFVTHGAVADWILVATQAEPHPDRPGVAAGNLFLINVSMPGVSVGEPSHKIGLGAMDTVDIFLDGVRVPRSHLLGPEGLGFMSFTQIMPRERLAIAVSALALAERLLADTVQYCRTRETFGRPLTEHQHVRFELAEMATALRVARAYTDQCVDHRNGSGITTEDAAMAKLWNTDLCSKVADRCLQLHGGWGYADECLVGRAYVDARAQKIYGGTSEIMKEIIGQAVVGGAFS